MHWNNEHLKMAYEDCARLFETYGHTRMDVKRMAGERLSAKEFKTGSARIEQIVMAAYFVGQLSAIRECDQIMSRSSNKENTRP